MNLDATRESSESLTRAAIASAQDILVPDLYDLILAMNRDCGFEAFMNNLIEIFETHFGAQRLSISVPRDATDIINIPWGLKALWNRNKPVEEVPAFSTNGDNNLDSKVDIVTTQDDEDSWDTDTEDDDDYGIEDDHDSNTTVNGSTAQQQTDERPPMGRTSSFKQKFSLTRKLSFRRNSSASSSSPVSAKQLSPEQAKTGSVTPTPLTDAPRESVEEGHGSNSSNNNNSNTNVHLRIFDSIRTLEWEEDPLIDAQGVINVLDNDQLVMLQRKYTSPSPSKIDAWARESRDFFYDTEQATASPWSRSPAPSPAIRETNENPFFTQTHEMDRAFEDPNPEKAHHATRPVDAIGYEDTYSIIHVLLIVPSKAGQSHQQRSAPVAVLSFMSSLIPFPSKLRGVIDRLAPHIATSYVQACAHSNLVKLVSNPTLRPGSSKGVAPGSHLKRSQYFELSPSSSVKSTSPQVGNTGDIPNLDYFNDLTFTDSETRMSPSARQPSGPQRMKSSPAKVGDQSHSRKFLRRHRVRPHIRKLLHSYGASFMSEPEKAPTSHPSPSPQPDQVYESGKKSTDTGSMTSIQSENIPQRRRLGGTSEMRAPSNKLLRTMLDAIPVHVFMADPVQGDVTWVSNRTLSFRGQTSEEFMRDPTASIHPDDMDDYVRSWNSALEKGEPLSKMVQVRRFDGRYRAFFMRAVPLRDDKGVITHWFCTLMDIHNQRQSQLEALQQAHEVAGEQKYKSLAESTPIIVFTTHPSKGVQYANNKWFDYSGRTAAETYGFQYVNAIHPDDRHKGVLPLTSRGKPDYVQYQKENKTGIYSVELRLLNKDGDYRWHLATFSCSDTDSAADSIWFGTCTDIHDQKLIQEKLKEAKDAAQRTIESKSRFLSNMSHEIRTPLIGISGMVGFLLDTSLTDEQLDYCHTISSSSEALLMVINDILDLSKVESGKMYLSYSWFHVRRLVEEVNELLSSMAISKNLELNYIIENDVPSWVKGDRVRLRQVMLNLIGNAIKFTDQGEIFTHCRIKQTEVDDNSVMMEFKVHDTGRGFTEDDSKRMFQPYSQVHDGFKNGVSPVNNAGSASGTGGTGLGLVISRQLIQLHGGELTAEGVKNKGSTFTFTCKVNLPSDQDAPSDAERAKAMGPTDPEVSQPAKIESDLKILVVCPYNFTFQSISHHILTTVADPARCQIKQVHSVEEAIRVFDNEKGDEFSHIVVNSNELSDVVRLIKFMYSVRERLAKTEIILLTTPTQRTKIAKRLSITDKTEPKVTFLPKPLKPSRYSVVFDPSRLRAESRDTKMMNAQQTLESHKSVFDELSKFAYGKSYRILLAEDNLVNQKVMSKFLHKAGLKCDVAADGEVCTARFFEKGVGYYSMILCDLDMPRKDGFGVCEEIREWEKKMNLTPKTPIVALSAYVQSDMSDRCDEVGFTQYISKPVEFTHLKDVIIEILTDVEAQ